MENITLEQIDLIMQRANVSYGEAKSALETCNGDIVEALLLLEVDDKIKTEKSPTPQNNHPKHEKLNTFISKLNATNFIMKKKDRTYIDIPLSVALIFGITCFYASIIAIIVALAFGIRIKISGENDIAEKLNSTFDQFTK